MIYNQFDSVYEPEESIRKAALDAIENEQRISGYSASRPDLEKVAKQAAKEKREELVDKMGIAVVTTIGVIIIVIVVKDELGKNRDYAISV